MTVLPCGHLKKVLQWIRVLRCSKTKRKVVIFSPACQMLCCRMVVPLVPIAKLIRDNVAGKYNVFLRLKVKMAAV